MPALSPEVKLFAPYWGDLLSAEQVLAIAGLTRDQLPDDTTAASCQYMAGLATPIPLIGSALWAAAMVPRPPKTAGAANSFAAVAGGS